MKTAIALILLAVAVVAGVNAAEYSPTTARAATDATWTPASVEVSAPATIELAPVVITAKAPRKARIVTQRATCGAFAPRALEQGSGNVSGFCP